MTKFTKNPLHLLHQYLVHTHHGDFSYKRLAGALEEINQKLHGKRTTEDKFRKRAFDQTYVSKTMAIDYFENNAIRANDIRVMDAVLSEYSEKKYKSLFRDREKIELEVGVRDERLNRDTTIAQNFRGIWQVLYLSLKRDNLQTVKRNDSEYIVRESILIFFGFTSNEMKVAFVGPGFVATGTAILTLRSDLLFIDLKEDGELMERVRFVYRVPAFPRAAYMSSRTIFMEGIRLGTTADQSYPRGPIIGLACVARRLDKASESFKMNDVIIDTNDLGRYQSDFCSYRTAKEYLEMSITRTEFDTLDDDEKVLRERVVELGELVSIVTKARPVLIE